MASSPGLSRPPPYRPPLAGEGRVGDGTMPDYRDDRDIRAFTPVFDGCCPAMTVWGPPRVLPLLQLHVAFVRPLTVKTYPAGNFCCGTRKTHP